MIWIYDKRASKRELESNGLGILDRCISAVIIQELNGEYTLELEYPLESAKSYLLVELNIIKAEGQLFRIYKTERIQDSTCRIRVWAKHIFYDLAFCFIENIHLINVNMKEALEGTIPPELQAQYLITAYGRNIAPFSLKETNGVDAVYRIIQVYGGEILRDNFNINIVDKLGDDSPVLIKYGKNIRGMRVIQDCSEMATRIFPVGASGLTLPEKFIEAHGERSKLLDIPITKKVEFKECSDIESLRIKAKEYIEIVSQNKININVDFLQLSMVEEYKEYGELADLNIGDRVCVKNERLATKTTLRVLKKSKDLINPINTKIELGDPLSTIIEKLDRSKLLEEIKEAISGTLSNMIIKKNKVKITLRQSLYPAMIIGIKAKADTNLSCNVAMTCNAKSDCSLEILFSLDGIYYDFKPVQKLAQGDNIISIPLSMTQISMGEHTFMIEMKSSEGEIILDKNNLQVTIEGRELEGGISASFPRAEVVTLDTYKVFKMKMDLNRYQEHMDIRKLCNLQDEMRSRYTHEEFMGNIEAFNLKEECSIILE